MTKKFMKLKIKSLQYLLDVFSCWSVLPIVYFKIIYFYIFTNFYLRKRTISDSSYNFLLLTLYLTL